MTKFNPKVFLGKDRVRISVPGAPNIYRVLFWNDERKIYEPPERGKAFFACRWEVDSFNRKQRKTCSFDSLQQARDWVHGCNAPLEAPSAPQVPFVSSAKVPFSSQPPQPQKEDVGPLFRTVVEEFRQQRYPSYAEGTRTNYDQVFKLHLDFIMDMPIRSLNSRSVDNIIKEWKTNSAKKTWQSRKLRINFRHELELLSAVCTYYRNYGDDPDYRHPILQRHWQDVKYRKKTTVKSKDLTPEELEKFVFELGKHRWGRVLKLMAIVQYYQALRISEVAALHWEDVFLDFKRPFESRLVIKRHAVWARRAGDPSKVVLGFKNSEANDGVKEQPVFPQAFEALKELYHIGGRGLVFEVKSELVTYRMIQKAYDDAFKRAGLNYSGTHVMRHGGCRTIYNETSDAAIAAQMLGNREMHTVLLYAKRDKSALKKLVREHWERDAQKE